jgi:hypothetical protein
MGIAAQAELRRLTLDAGRMEFLGDVVVADQITLGSHHRVDQLGGSLTCSRLLLLGAGDYVLPAAENDVDILAADLNPGSLAIADADGLVVGSLGSVTGVSTGEPDDGGPVEITANGLIYVDQPISTRAGSGGNLSTGPGVVINAEVLLGAGDVTLKGVASQPLGEVAYFSLAWGGILDGIRYGDEDILAFDTVSRTWSMYFDGSDVGLRSSDVDAIHVAPNDPTGSILISFKSPRFLPGLQFVDDSDIIRFIPTSTGAQTAGRFEFFLDGSDVGLTRNRDDIDGISFTPDGRLVVSTRGSDLLVLEEGVFGTSTSGTWDLYFDGSDVGLTRNSEDIDAVSIQGGNISLSTRGWFSVLGVRGFGNDVLNCIPESLGEETKCSEIALVFRGKQEGLRFNRVDGLSVRPSSTTVTSTTSANQELWDPIYVHPTKFAHGNNSLPPDRVGVSQTVSGQLVTQNDRDEGSIAWGSRQDAATRTGLFTYQMSPTVRVKKDEPSVSSEFMALAPSVLEDGLLERLSVDVGSHWHDRS